MRKFTYKDVRDWKVTDVRGKQLALPSRDKNGEVKMVTRFDGFRSASRAAKKLGGRAMRA